MIGYIYNIDGEIVVKIQGESNGAIEAKAEALGYMGVDEYALAYNCNGLAETAYTETVEA